MPDLTIDRAFDRIAHLYDSGWAQRALYTALQDRAFAELRVLRPASVLDVGCGTGIFADRLDREVAPGGVTGCDLSTGMLAQAAGRTHRVGWVRGDSAHLPLRTGALDAVVCTQAFHFFDQPAAWAEFRRVLAPGGVALVGMMNPPSESRSRRWEKALGAVARARITLPTMAGMHRLASDAGFEVTAQIEIDYRFKRVMPLVLTVARVTGV
ncbi:MAG TPA: methyltransferase domain-containing protein [Acidimicrobiia bacterium]|nr:methyltransferase domain-containing protein [Acidimicrobiia bacterium]